MSGFDHLAAARYWWNQAKRIVKEMPRDEMPHDSILKMRAHLKRGGLELDNLKLTEKKVTNLINKSYLKCAKKCWDNALFHFYKVNSGEARKYIDAMDEFLNKGGFVRADLDVTNRTVTTLLRKSDVRLAQRQWSNAIIVYEEGELPDQYAVKNMDAYLALAGKTRKDIGVSDKDVKKILSAKPFGQPMRFRKFTKS